MTRYSQFSIRTLLWLTLVVAAFLGGMAAERQITVVEATQRERKLERALSGLRGELRRRDDDARHFQFRIEQLEKQRDQAAK